MRHHRLRPSAEQPQQFVDQPPLRRIARQASLENMRIADLFRAPDRSLPFQTINSSLDGRIRRPAFRRKRFLNLANRGPAQIPERLHDLQLQFGQSWQRHNLSTMSVCNPTTSLFGLQEVLRTNILLRKTYQEIKRV